jgi:molecular chaperone DnaK
MQAKDVPYRVVSDPESKYAVMTAVDTNGRDFLVSPEEVSAHVLRTLLDAAEAEIGMVIERAVITVPAYFDDRQCEATIRAGEIAGLKTVKLLKEPVAAALAYGVDVDDDETVFVFDLGGGTFDVSVLEVGGGTVEVLATGGDPHLGGDDFDRVVAEWLSQEAKKMGAEIDPRGALSVARKAREALSDQDQVEIPMPGGGKRVITRSMFEKLVIEVLRRMRRPVSIAADSAGVDLEAIMDNARRKDGASRAAGRPFDQILLVGGATRSPCVRRFVENTMDRKPNTSLVNPDEAVALGAAIHAGSLEGTVENVQTLNSMQASLIRALTVKMQAQAANVDASFDDDDEYDEDDWGPEDLDALRLEEGSEDEDVDADVDKNDEKRINKR